MPGHGSALGNCVYGAYLDLCQNQLTWKRWQSLPEDAEICFTVGCWFSRWQDSYAYLSWKFIWHSSEELHICILLPRLLYNSFFSVLFLHSEMHPAVLLQPELRVTKGPDVGDREWATPQSVTCRATNAGLTAHPWQGSAGLCALKEFFLFINWGEKLVWCDKDMTELVGLHKHLPSPLGSLVSTRPAAGCGLGHLIAQCASHQDSLKPPVWLNVSLCSHLVTGQFRRSTSDP